MSTISSFKTCHQTQALIIFLLLLTWSNIFGQIDLKIDSININCYCRDFTNSYYNVQQDSPTIDYNRFNLQPLVGEIGKWSLGENEKLVFESSCLSLLHGFTKNQKHAIENSIQFLNFLKSIHFFDMKNIDPRKTLNYLTLDDKSYRMISNAIVENGETNDVKSYWCYALKLLATNVHE